MLLLHAHQLLSQVRGHVAPQLTEARVCEAKPAQRDRHSWATSHEIVHNNYTQDCACLLLTFPTSQPPLKEEAVADGCRCGNMSQSRGSMVHRLPWLSLPDWHGDSQLRDLPWHRIKLLATEPHALYICLHRQGKPKTMLADVPHCPCPPPKVHHASGTILNQLLLLLPMSTTSN